ncbi:MAG: 3-phosphoserine/phosphohydroxythreonine transaminase [Actinomycetota bacterium]
MTERTVNFSAGPGILPLSVLRQAQTDLISLPGVGASALEVSHRGAWFTDVIAEAEANLRALLAIPATHRVLFTQGGATMQFTMVPMNLLRATGRHADFIVTGSWGAKAWTEAAKEGTARLAWTGKDEGYVRAPETDELLASINANPAYVHITTNETIQGVEYPETPIVPDDVALVADGSSDFLSRPIDVGGYAVLYAGAQKNAGPAGVTIVIVRDDALAHVPEGLPAMLDYRTYAEHGSLYNTPPVFSIYILLLVTRWLREDIGGLEAMHERNRAKAAQLYDVLDALPAFYRGHADRSSRSLMNVTFRLPTVELEHAFIAEAAAAGMVDLAGHRSVGGVRASIYNAMPLDGVERLAAFMRAFADGRS